MKKTSLIKGILLILLSVTLIGTTAVYAADDLDSDLDDMLNFSSTPTNTTPTNTTPTNTAPGNTTPTNTTTNTTNSIDDLFDNTSNTSSNENTSTNTSLYTNSDDEDELPDTGIEDSLPMVVLIAVFGISAVYAYVKIKEYNNI